MVSECTVVAIHCNAIAPSIAQFVAQTVLFYNSMKLYRIVALTNTYTLSAWFTRGNSLPILLFSDDHFHYDSLHRRWFVWTLFYFFVIFRLKKKNFYQYNVHLWRSFVKSHHGCIFRCYMSSSHVVACKQHFRIMTSKLKNFNYILL